MPGKGGLNYSKRGIFNRWLDFICCHQTLPDGTLANQIQGFEKDRETVRQREREREKDKEGETETETERWRETETEKETETGRQRETIGSLNHSATEPSCKISSEDVRTIAIFEDTTS